MRKITFLMIALSIFFLSACGETTSTPASPSFTTTPHPTATAVPPTPSPTFIPSPTLDARFSADVIDYTIQLVEQRKAPGIAIGLLTPQGVSYFNHGAFTWESEQAIDERTLFEIGSITKVFTALLLANAVEEGQINLDTPAQDLAPEGVSLPAYANQPVTLLDLVTQRSLLPRMPSNFSPQNTFNPYMDYPAESMYEYLDGYKLMSPPGTAYEYSNLGFMLLGDLMERAYGKPYENLVIEIITDPLDMPDTRITLSEEQAARLAQGHSDVYPVSAWDFLLPGAGALRSTTTDMLRFLDANLQPGDDTLDAAMQRIRSECFDTGTYFIQVCLGIHTYTRFSKTIYWHNGQTGGYHSFAGFVPEDGTAVVVLVNSNYNIDELALHLLDPEAPLPAVP